MLVEGMSDDSFTHDENHFGRAAHPGSVGVSDAEARYAELFSEVIWDGVITPDKRQRLQTAAETFGLSAERARQIEQALEAAHRLKVIEERDTRTETGDDERSLDPLIDSNDPLVLVLQRRIHLLEQEHTELQRENARLVGLNEGLEELVNQLQSALESTLGELDDVHQRLTSTQQEMEEARRAQAAARQHEQPALEPPAQPAAPPSSVVPVSAPALVSSAPPVSVPFKRAPSAPGADAPPVQGWSAEPDAEPPPAVDLPEPAPTVRGFAPPEEGAVLESPPEHSMTHRRHDRSRRLLASAEGSAPMAAMRARRENPAEIHKLLRARPRDTELLHELFRSLERAEDTDRRWCIAHTLVYLGDAGDEEREVYIEQLSTGLVRPARAVNEDEWRELLFHPDEDPLTSEILACIAPAVLLGQMSSVRQHVLDPSERVEPKGSTLQAVRCVEWAAAFLGLELPPLYASPDHEGTADVVLNPAPSTRLGKHALVGRSSKELAFVAGRHLTWYRKEHLIARPSRSVRRLEDLFLAALMIGNPGLPIARDIKQRVEPIVQTIRPLLDAETVAKLGHCFSRFVEHGGRTSLSRWCRGVERTSACTGLLLANDLHVAEAMLTLEHSFTAAAQRQSVAEALDELIVFFTAGRCSILRKRIGIAVAAT